MTFEEEKITMALATLKATEKRCSMVPTMANVMPNTALSSSSSSSMSQSPSLSSIQQAMKNKMQLFLGGSKSSGQSPPTVSVVISFYWRQQQRRGNFHDWSPMPLCSPSPFFPPLPKKGPPVHTASRVTTSRSRASPSFYGPEMVMMSPLL